MARPMKYTANQLDKLIYGEKGYFNWIKENPFYKYDVVKTGQDAGKELKVKVDRMPSIQGLCAQLRIDESLFYIWVNDAKGYSPTEEQKKASEVKNKIQFFEIVTCANNDIKQQQIEGAGSGLYQPMIAARLNKLKDTAEVTTTTIDATNKTDEEIKAAIQAIQAARK